MAQIKRNRCYVCDKGVAYGNNVSHANNKTRRTWQPNMQRKRFWYPAENRFIRLTLSVQGIKHIDKVGIDAVVAVLRTKGVRF